MNTGINFFASGKDEAERLIVKHHHTHRLPGSISECFVARLPGGLTGVHGDVVAAVTFGHPQARWDAKTRVLEMSRLVKHPEYDVQMNALVRYGLSYIENDRRCDLIIAYVDPRFDHHDEVWYQQAGFAFGTRIAPTNIGAYDKWGNFWHGRILDDHFGTRSEKELNKRVPEYGFRQAYDDGKIIYWRILTPRGKAATVRYLENKKAA